MRLGDNGSQSVRGLGDPPCGVRSFKPSEMGFVLEGQTCSEETVALAVGWGRDWGQQGRDGACCVPASYTGPGWLVTLGSEGLAFQVGRADHADLGNVHGLCLHL